MTMSLTIDPMVRSPRSRVLLLACLLLSACAGGGSGGGASPSSDAGKPNATAPTTKNSPPAISGIPETFATVGRAYAFQPVSSDPEGDPVRYTIANKPAWAAFDAISGLLTGTPSEADLGTYAGIVISVTDGAASAELAPFSITVSAVQAGAATLTWLPPTENTDGTPIQDLAGFRIRYGRDPEALTEVESIPNPGISSAVVENLSSGTWYFTVTAYNIGGVESEYSNFAQKTIL